MHEKEQIHNQTNLQRRKYHFTTLSSGVGIIYEFYHGFLILIFAHKSILLIRLDFSCLFFYYQIQNISVTANLVHILDKVEELAFFLTVSINKVANKQKKTCGLFLGCDVYEGRGLQMVLAGSVILPVMLQYQGTSMISLLQDIMTYRLSRGLLVASQMSI